MVYLYLGRGYVLHERDLIGIFNLETTTISPRGREFLDYAQKNGAVVSLSDELPQSYVLADSGGYGVPVRAVPCGAAQAGAEKSMGGVNTPSLCCKNRHRNAKTAEKGCTGIRYAALL